MDIEKKRDLANAFFVFHTNRNRQGALTVRDSPWSDAFMCAMIQVEDILNLCCLLLLDKQ